MKGLEIDIIIRNIKIYLLSNGSILLDKEIEPIYQELNRITKDIKRYKFISAYNNEDISFYGKPDSNIFLEIAHNHKMVVLIYNEIYTNLKIALGYPKEVCICELLFRYIMMYNIMKNVDDISEYRFYHKNTLPHPIDICIDI